MKLAIVGTRGVPASYGGFETFAEELGRRLVERGHRVTVYGRVPYVGSERRYYVEANGPDYRVWKRTSGSEGRAVEIYQRYRFWAWWIEACCHWRPATRFLTWIMHKTI